MCFWNWICSATREIVHEKIYIFQAMIDIKTFQKLNCFIAHRKLEQNDSPDIFKVKYNPMKKYSGKTTRNLLAPFVLNFVISSILIHGGCYIDAFSINLNWKHWLCWVRLFKFLTNLKMGQEEICISQFYFSVDSCSPYHWHH